MHHCSKKVKKKKRWSHQTAIFFLLFSRPPHFLFSLLLASLPEIQKKKILAFTIIFRYRLFWDVVRRWGLLLSGLLSILNLAPDLTSEGTYTLPTSQRPRSAWPDRNLLGVIVPEAYLQRVKRRLPLHKPSVSWSFYSRMQPSCERKRSAVNR